MTCILLVVLPIQYTTRTKTNITTNCFFLIEWLFDLTSSEKIKFSFFKMACVVDRKLTLMD